MAGRGTAAGIANCADVSRPARRTPAAPAAFTGDGLRPAAGRGPQRRHRRRQDPVAGTDPRRPAGAVHDDDDEQRQPPADQPRRRRPAAPTPDGTPPTPDVNSVWYWGSSSAPTSSRRRWRVARHDRGLHPRRRLAGRSRPTSPPTGDAAFPTSSAYAATIDVLRPTESFDLRVGHVLAGVPLPPDGAAGSLTNCYGVTADTASDDDEYDARRTARTRSSRGRSRVGGPSTSRSPRRRCREPIPGMTPQNATVTLQIRNNGTLTAQDAPAHRQRHRLLGRRRLRRVRHDHTARQSARCRRRPSADRRVRRRRMGRRHARQSRRSPGAARPAVTADAGARAALHVLDTCTLNDGFVLTPCAGSERRAPASSTSRSDRDSRWSARDRCPTPTRARTQLPRHGCYRAARLGHRRVHDPTPPRRPAARSTRSPTTSSSSPGTPAARRQQDAGERHGHARPARHVRPRDDEQRHRQPARRDGRRPAARRDPVRRHVRGPRHRPAVHGDVVEPARRLPGAAGADVRGDAPIPDDPTRVGLLRWTFAGLGHAAERRR